ncbi:probable E3 ubiquitin-protein ligase HECTD2 isoform X1 [Haliotis asinina]|uniref:probable E3 ubiquitin-protein ligase HECTD2 isoform X1 n=1 Tax=Haliotis asinina TaxID=109174 RepID=UPI003531DA1B
MCSLSMAASPGSGGVVSVTCPTCSETVLQPPGSKRTICPRCGNFYERASAERPPSYHRSREKRGRGKGDQNDKGKSGPLNVITSLFRSSPDEKRRDRGSTSSEHGTSKPTELPRIEGGGGQLTGPQNQNRPTYLSTGGSRTSRSPRSSPNPDRSPKSPSPNPSKVNYPVRTKTAEQLKEDVSLCRSSGDWHTVQDFYATLFESFIELNAAFKRDPSKDYKTTDDPGLKFDLLTSVFSTLLTLPQDLQKDVLKAIINSLLKDKRSRDHRVWPNTKDDLRAYLILIHNPQFSNMTTYVIFAHLLRQIAALSDHDHHFLVHWLRKIPSDQFKSIVGRLHNFISCRLFPPKPQDLPPLSKCTWWIPSATKVMALFNAANNLSLPSIVPYTDFYNSSLDHLDLMAEYYAWQNPSSHAGFSFCQYPFILSIAAKRTILQKDSEQQMIIMARKSLVAKVQRRQLPDIGMLFLNLTVRRSHLVSDSLNEIARKHHDLKKKLKVTFAGEPGLDMGGLTKEWFLLLIRQIFQPEYGMFNYDKTAGVYWFSAMPCENYQEFNLVGVLMGLAVYNSINLDIRFPPCCYKKLLSPAVVPFSNPRATVGVATVTLDDLMHVKPAVAKGLKDLLEYEEDVEEDFCLTFEVSNSEYGSMKTVLLKPNGDNIPVTKENRKEYVQLYVEFILNKSVYPQFQAFYHGFHSVCASNALIMLRPEEVEMLVCGSPTINISDLKKVTVYEGYSPQDQTIRYFWDMVTSMPMELQKKLLLFATGSDRIPIGGTQEMQFKISRISGTDLLPMAHTCFNQLVLPPYKSRKVLKQKLIAAIQNAEGFGLE